VATMHRAITPGLRQRAAVASSRMMASGAEFVGRSVRTAPGILGAGLVTYGAGQVWAPLLFLVGGAFLMILDRRMP
jgi:hypothetical protein